jgi:hypothetical protein
MEYEVGDLVRTVIDSFYGTSDNYPHRDEIGIVVAIDRNSPYAYKGRYYKIRWLSKSNCGDTAWASKELKLAEITDNRSAIIALKKV